MLEFIAKIKDLDRRIIFALTFLAVIVPMLFPKSFFWQPGKEVRNIYDKIESLPAGGKIVISFDYDPQTGTEVHPMAISLLHHCFKTKKKVYILALWPQGASLADSALKEVIYNEDKTKRYNVEYGIDYINFGYKPGGAIIIQALVSDFSILPTDAIENKPTYSFPIMKDVKNLTSIDLVLSLSSGGSGMKEWVMIAQAQARVPTGGGCTAVSAPEFYPYYGTGQLVGILGGLKGAADYEQLIKRPGPASEGMWPQSVVHMMIIVFIIIANLTYWAEIAKSR